jgi:hypothetical protein
VAPLPPPAPPVAPPVALHEVAPDAPLSAGDWLHFDDHPRGEATVFTGNVTESIEPDTDVQRELSAILDSRGFNAQDALAAVEKEWQVMCQEVALDPEFRDCVVVADALDAPVTTESWGDHWRTFTSPLDD